MIDGQMIDTRSSAFLPSSPKLTNLSDLNKVSLTHSSLPYFSNHVPFQDFLRDTRKLNHLSSRPTQPHHPIHPTQKVVSKIFNTSHRNTRHMHNINNFSRPTIQLLGFTSYPSGGEFSLLTITMTPRCDIEAGLRHSRFENNPRVGTSKSCFLTTHTRTHIYSNYNDNNNKHAWCFVSWRRK